ncbi:MAG: hypothetical protein PUB03_01995 [bacterium]|nr:hypothetical protein [bacterium]
MQDKDKLINKLNNDVIRLQRKLECQKLYNARNLVVSSLLKGVQVVDLALPFVVSVAMLVNAPNFKENPPFHRDEITVDTDIETIDTSSGIHLEHIGTGFNYKTEMIKYSTGWTVDDKNHYERTETIYKLDDKLNLNNLEEVLAMSKEELEQMLKITSNKTIEKDVLTPDDSIYNKDALIVVNHSTTKDQTVRLEKPEEDFKNSITYLFLVFAFGSGLWKVENLFVEKYGKDKLEALERFEVSFANVKKTDLEKMKEVLKLRQENLSMLTDDKKDGYPYKLKK